MTRTILLLLGLLVIGAVAFVVIKRDNFDITVEPVRTSYKKNIYDCPTPLAEQGGGLNTQGGGADYTICKFQSKYKDKLAYPELDPYDVVPRAYCSMMYDSYHDDFTTRWESLGVCEQDTKKTLASACPRNA